MSAESQNCEASRDSRRYGTALQTRPLLGDRFVNSNNTRAIAKQRARHQDLLID
jgi:hypothetical protein